ncbi:MAG: hypothetical protein L0099_13105, partial [Acidobacteria bacterium]|nr:hypothetical protein [Acidobacteriota bacterium]
MAETWRYRGQEISSQQIAFLREFIREHADSSRWKLSRQLCEALGWKQANGALRDVVCRGLLLMLERAGQIELPPVRCHIRGQRRTGRPRPEAVLIDTTPLAMPLKALGAVDIQPVRHGAAAYRGAQKIPVPHATLKAGSPCLDPQCEGKVYPQREPGVLVRIKGQPPLAAAVYELEKLRCNLCGNMYTAAAPPEAGEKKYDETAVSMIAVLRYGAGVPWNRTEGLEANFGIPLPAA